MMPVPLGIWRYEPQRNALLQHFSILDKSIYRPVCLFMYFSESTDGAAWQLKHETHMLVCSSADACYGDVTHP